MPIRPLVFSLLLFSLLGGAKKFIETKDQPEAVRMAELLGNPDRFNGKLVTVIGYLVIGGKDVIPDSTLSLDKNDDENGLGNGMGVIPNPEMLRNRRELTGTYVVMTGVIVTREWPRGRMLAIQEITECKVWSDPEHPRFGKLPSQP